MAVIDGSNGGLLAWLDTPSRIVHERAAARGYDLRQVQRRSADIMEHKRIAHAAVLRHDTKIMTQRVKLNLRRCLCDLDFPVTATRVRQRHQ